MAKEIQIKYIAYACATVEVPDNFLKNATDEDWENILNQANAEISKRQVNWELDEGATKVMPTIQSW